MTETKYNQIKPTNVAKITPESIEASPTKKTHEKMEPLELKSGVGVRKKTVIERLVAGMVGPNGAKSIGSYVVHTIIIPKTKEVFFNSFTQGLSMALGLDGRKMNNQQQKYPNPNKYYSGRPQQQPVNYGSAYSQGSYQQSAHQKRPGITQIADYVFMEYSDALTVLDTMRYRIDSEGDVTLAAYYDWIGVKSDWADMNYGWHDLSNARIVTSRNGGYMLSLPPLEPIGV